MPPWTDPEFWSYRDYTPEEEDAFKNRRNEALKRLQHEGKQSSDESLIPLGLFVILCLIGTAWVVFH